jgi:hypothetical protein
MRNVVSKRGAHSVSKAAHNKEIQMYVHEFALLIAVTTPLAILFCKNAGLWAAGERDTLLLPVMRAYPRVEIVDTMAADVVVSASVGARNDEDFRLAA